MKDIAKKFHGVSAFLVTPTADDGERVDEARLRTLIDAQIRAGVDSITVLGSTGANGSFTEEERKRVISVAVEHVAGRVPLIAGTGSMTTSETIRLSKFAAAKGVSAVLVVPVTYWPLKETEIDAHYTAIAAAVDAPIGIYNNPTTTGTDIKPPQIERLARIDNVAFVKEGSAERIAEIRRLTGDTVVVGNGRDSIALEVFAVGAHAWFSGGCNLLPDECVKLFALGNGDGPFSAARDYFAALYPVFAMQSTKSTLRVVHTGMDLLGLSAGPPRQPLRYLLPEDRAALAAVLRRIKPALARAS
jgi:4-hydroxy-tetrahydrodipicolinate synthase